MEALFRARTEAYAVLHGGDANAAAVLAHIGTHSRRCVRDCVRRYRTSPPSVEEIEALEPAKAQLYVLNRGKAVNRRRRRRTTVDSIATASSQENSAMAESLSVINESSTVFVNDSTLLSDSEPRVEMADDERSLALDQLNGSAERRQDVDASVAEAAEDTILSDLGKLWCLANRILEPLEVALAGVDDAASRSVAWLRRRLCERLQRLVRVLQAGTRFAFFTPSAARDATDAFLLPLTHERNDLTDALLVEVETSANLEVEPSPFPATLRNPRRTVGLRVQPREPVVSLEAPLRTRVIAKEERTDRAAPRPIQSR